MKRIILFALTAVVTLSSCWYIGGKRVHGNGNITTSERTAGTFKSVEVSGALNVYVKQDSARHAVKVEADENLQEFIVTEEHNGVLHIYPRNNYNLDPTRKIKIYVFAPQYSRFVVSGASEISGENRLVSNETIDVDLSGASVAKFDIKAPGVNAEASGASTIALNGETKDLSIDGSGASHFECFGLLAENTSVGLSGACSAEVYGSVKLDVEASGASDVRYRGAAAVTQDLSGASNIKKVD